MNQTFSRVVQHDEGIIFQRADGRGYYLYHEQDCCESVYIESVHIYKCRFNKGIPVFN